ncbi:hypothetical protein COV06_03515 [Candidatus Uhrbacteria bacterium CG10_big_fil_rev_8_21_14_0_10_50_16]|uniref:Carbohydrate kinase PfkB domain-containing protein n=1 Tax=Candidatus Uhrbacteria bacterium CG10_big_fil_rev_8_21_14_0_10_50_16 TaxID=1975039 RepID=A0A2H0RLR7_9BACT|nr:MAG: hypothetical protein COV06_03515 [Candidatus Uhrbacteria bacterium CG10_big_fil_rev_8_21_14_0_10_50_16]
MNFDVITIGAAVRDVYVQSKDFIVEERGTNTIPEACFVLGGKLEVEAPYFSSGGGATNAAATFAHLGLKTSCIAKIGADDTGRDIINDLRTHGVHTNLLISTDKEQTGYSTLLTTNDGRRTALVYRGASASVQAKELPWERMTCKWLYLSSLNGDLGLLKKIFAHAATNDIHVTWNPGSASLKQGLNKLAPLLRRTDILSLNREEAAQLTRLAPSDLRTIIKRLNEHVGGAVVITDGNHGAYASNGGETFFAFPGNIAPTNTTGAGDAFGSAFTAGMIVFQDPIMAIRLATINAESVIQKVGAKNGILDRMPGSRRLGQIRVEPYTL